jgi:acyl carrier protein
MQSIEEMIRQHISENILFDSQSYPYPDDASLLENNIIDSMNVIELVVFLEEQLGLQIEDNEIVPENFDSVSCLAEFARRKQSSVASTL